MKETCNPLEHPNPSKLWFHRRSIAYLSMAGLFIMQLLLITNAIEAHAVPVAQTLSWVFGFNIIAYVANNAFESVAAMKFGK